MSIIIGKILIIGGIPSLYTLCIFKFKFLYCLNRLYINNNGQGLYIEIMFYILFKCAYIILKFPLLYYYIIIKILRN